jgi:hypothetical protein
MKTALLFLPSGDPGARQVYAIDDETVQCDALPDAEFGDAIMLSVGKFGEILFSPDPKVHLIHQGMRLSNEVLFLDLHADDAAVWAAACGTRRLFAHELQPVQQRGGLTGALPVTISGTLAQPMLTASSLRARCSQMGHSASLTVQRGHVELLHWFDPTEGTHSIS